MQYCAQNPINQTTGLEIYLLKTAEIKITLLKPTEIEISLLKTTRIEMAELKTTSTTPNKFRSPASPSREMEPNTTSSEAGSSTTALKSVRVPKTNSKSTNRLSSPLVKLVADWRASSALKGIFTQQ